MPSPVDDFFLTAAGLFDFVAGGGGGGNTGSERLEDLVGAGVLVATGDEPAPVPVCAF